MWIHDHRPESLEEIALDSDHRKLVTSYLQDGEIPHLLLKGPPGTGKTSLAEVLIEELDCEELIKNASNQRGISTIRGEIRNFTRASIPSAVWNIIVLDEADGLTKQAQQAMLALMENYASVTRYIVIANRPEANLIEPLRSRCTTLDMADPPPKERKTALWHVLASAGAEFDHEALEYFAQRHSDVRTLINEAEKNVKIYGRLTIPPEEDAA